LCLECIEEVLIGGIGDFKKNMVSKYFGKELLFANETGYCTKPREFYEVIEKNMKENVKRIELLCRKELFTSFLEQINLKPFYKLLEGIVFRFFANFWKGLSLNLL